MSLKKKAKYCTEIYESRPWYHDFSSLSVQTNFENTLPLKEKLCNWYSRLEEIGWIICDHATNELTGNYRACDMGSSYYLLGKKEVS